MEATNMQFISSIASAILTGGYYGYKFWKKYNKKKLFGVLTSEKSGISEALKEVEHNDNLIIVDISEIIKLDGKIYNKLETLEHDKNYYDVILFDYVKEHLKKLRKINKNKIIVVITSNNNLLRFLKVKDKYISILVPTIEYQVELIKSFSNTDDIDKLQHSKETLMELKYPVFKFKNKNKLVDLFDKLFNPKK
jgi:TusA-related sulfurtransferase